MPQLSPHSAYIIFILLALYFTSMLMMNFWTTKSLWVNSSPSSTTSKSKLLLK
nr:ATP synthase F0 subunit 8 [Haplotrema minimum]